MSDRSQLDIIKHRGQREWTLPIPLHIRDEDQILRNSVRQVDYHYQRYPRITTATAIVWLVVIICAFAGIVYLIFG